MFKVRRVKPSAEDGWFGDEDSQEWSPYMAGACVLLYVSLHGNARLVSEHDSGFGVARSFGPIICSEQIICEIWRRSTRSWPPV